MPIATYIIWAIRFLPLYPSVWLFTLALKKKKSIKKTLIPPPFGFPLSELRECPYKPAFDYKIALYSI